MKIPYAILVLFLEDDGAELPHTVGLLRDAGYEVTGTGNLEEARQLLGARRYDLLIVDVQLRWSDGLQLIAQTRRDRPEMAALIITTPREPHAEVEARQVGAACQVKPFDRTSFLALVARELPPPPPLRRSPRKRVSEGLAVKVAEWPATIWDVSYEGFGFEAAPQIWQEPLPSVFKVNLATLGLSVRAEIMWTARLRASGSLSGGAALRETDKEIVGVWRGLVDRLSDHPRDGAPDALQS